LLRRNPIALLTALATPVAMVLATRASVPNASGGLGRGAAVVTSLTAFTLLFVVYYNLVTALVARREEPAPAPAAAPGWSACGSDWPVSAVRSPPRRSQVAGSFSRPGCRWPEKHPRRRPRRSRCRDPGAAYR
jgi:hypothetical protein